jgi:voltage-gated sodium channel
MGKLQDSLGGLRNRFGKKQESYKLPTAFEQLNAEFDEDVFRKQSHLAANTKFNIFIVCIILIDTVIIFVETDSAPAETLRDRMAFFVVDFAFGLIFISEMLIRMNQLGWDYFVDPWNVFDFSVVVLNCLDIVVAVSDETSNGLKLAGTFRVLRLLRVTRTIKGLKLFHGLWFVIQGLLESLRTLGWVAIMLGIIIYCAACALITAVDDVEMARVKWNDFDMYFGNLWRSMFTVLQIVSLDNWATDIARPMLEVSPIGTVFVVLVILLCTFGVLNIIVAVMVERIRTIAEENKAMTNRVLEHTEQDLFMSMATDFSEAQLNEDGELGFQEFEEMLKTPSMVLKLRLLGIMSDEAEALFEIMDADLNGSVSPEEFVTGLQKLKGVAKGQDLVQLICFAQKQCARATKFVERIRVLSEQADIIQERLNGMGHGITHELKFRKQTAIRNEEVAQQAAERQMMIGKLDKNRQLQFPALKA